mmetsp:Transcript_53680/g.115965  ORF Transcript_53680/g.115965 Transcript_53680/m.115965 type:complete len:229 (-) Transcript_53680:70-756(-)
MAPLCRRRVCSLAAAAGVLAALSASCTSFVGTPARLAPAPPRASRLQRQAERRTSSDNFIDKAFTVMADMLVSTMPLAQQEKDAYQYYRDGMAAQTSGDYSTALRAYAESLKIEEDPIDRSYIFYNLGIIFGSNGEYVKSVKYYHLALDQNKELPQAYNNIAVIYHNQGTRAEKQGNIDKAMVLYDKAAQYWNQAIRIAPTNYLEAQSWLKETGRAASFVDEKLLGIF